MVQAIPCPHPGEALYKRQKVDKNLISRLNIEFRRMRKDFEPFEFAIESPLFSNFISWWHNLMALYAQTPDVQNFAKHIGATITSGGVIQSGSPPHIR